MHMAGIRGEAQAECAAMQRDAQTAMPARRLRLAGTKLAARYWEHVYRGCPTTTVMGCAQARAWTSAGPTRHGAPITS